MELLNTIIISSATFTTLIISLVLLLLLAKCFLIKSGTLKIAINEDESLTKEVQGGMTLLNALSTHKIFLPSACGGGGTCAMCKCKVNAGGGDILPTETGHFSRKEIKENWRLSCQVKVKDHLKVSIPDEIFNIKKFECKVLSNQNVATFIKELILEIQGEKLNFKAGGYIQIDIPDYGTIPFSSFEIQEEYREDWDKYDLWKINAENNEPIFRAYSMANHPAEGNVVMLNVRIATPPPNTNFPPGISSSYIFNLKAGDKVTVSGPYGEFFVQDTQREMCFIGGGAGMAPMRSHIFHQFKTLKTQRKTTFWYGARSKRETFYNEDFLEIEKAFSNFKYTLALSEPLEEDHWNGPQGFIHQVALDNYLNNHEDPSEIEYYLCGPPMMIKCVNDMLFDLGVDKEMIRYDEF